MHWVPIVLGAGVFPDDPLHHGIDFQIRDPDSASSATEE